MSSALDPLPSDDRGRAPRWWKRRGPRRAAALLAALALLLWLWERWGLAPEPAGRLADPAREHALVGPRGSRSAEPPAAEDAAPPSVRLFGRCLDAATGAPLAAIPLWLEAEDGRRLDLESDVRGVFVAAWSGTSRLRVGAGSTPLWEPADAPRWLAPDERRGERAIELALARRPPPPEPARLVGRVRDALTDEGVDALAIRVAADDGRAAQELVTDARGRFESPAPVPGGDLVLELVDGEGAAGAVVARIDHAHPARAADARPLELRVPIGPRIELRLAPEDAPERAAGNPIGSDGAPAPDEDPGWRARIVERAGDPELAGALVREGGRWSLEPPAGEPREQRWSWAPLRSGDPAWIRYAAVEHASLPGARPWLVVASADGRWSGEAPLDSVRGRHPGVVAVRVAPRAGLSGRVVDETGEPFGGATLWLARVGPAAPQGRAASDADPPEATGPAATLRAEADGGFWFTDLALGTYRLEVTAPHRPRHARIVELSGGEHALEPIRLDAAPDPTGLLCHFRCERGHRGGRVLLRVAATDGPDLRRTALVELARQPDGWTGLASVGDLPHGSYRLDPLAPDYAHRWTPRATSVTTPCEPVEFRCSGAHAGTLVRARARDRASGSPLASWSPLLGPLGPELLTAPESPPAERWFYRPVDVPLHFTVHAPGYRPVYGDTRDLELPLGDRALVFDLDPGWGALLIFREPGALGVPAGGALDALDPRWVDAPPVPGVRVALTAAGRAHAVESDGDGIARLGAGDVPARLTLLRRGYRAVGASRLGRPHDPDALPRIVVWMEPR